MVNVPVYFIETLCNQRNHSQKGFFILLKKVCNRLIITCFITYLYLAKHLAKKLKVK